MKHVAWIVGVALLALPALATAGAAGETKWARGKATAVAADSLTVAVQGKDMTFTVDKDTKVIASGAGTKTAAAKAKGEPGISLTDAVKVGQSVRVRYQEMGGTLHAVEIRGGVLGEEETSDTAAKHASGKVTAVAADSLTVMVADKEMKFTIDANTRIVGKGAGTKTAENKAKGEGTTIRDLVSTNDQVVVTYHDMAGTLHAKTVRVMGKAGTQ